MFVASNGGSYVDTIWVLDLTSRKLTRHTCFAASACATAGAATTQGKIYIGDYDGVVWTLEAATDIERDLNEAGYDKSGTGTLTGSDPWTLTDLGADFPTTGTNVTGLRGTQVVLYDSTNCVRYTGLITGNAATTLTITNWLLNRTPPLGSYSYFIGGLDAGYATSWLDGGDPEHAKQVAQVNLDVDGEQSQLVVEARFADSARDLGFVQSRRWRVARATVNIREDMDDLTIPLRGRGRYVSLRIGNHAAGQPWTVRSAALRYCPVKAAR